MPNYNRYKKTYDNKNYNLVKIKNIVTKLNIPFIDIHKEVFKKEQNPLMLFHLNFTDITMLMDIKKLLKLFINLLKIETYFLHIV